MYIPETEEPVRINDFAEKMIQLYEKGTEGIICTGFRPGEKLYEELLLDKGNNKATEQDRIDIYSQETYEWIKVETWMDQLMEYLE